MRSLQTTLRSELGDEFPYQTSKKGRFNAKIKAGELFFELKNQYPTLTQKDMHLISFIMLGLSSKEIADIYNIEPQSVHTKRHRLRKKLGLQNDESFESFLNRNFKLQKSS